MLLQPVFDVTLTRKLRKVVANNKIKNTAELLGILMIEEMVFLLPWTNVQRVTRPSLQQ